MKLTKILLEYPGAFTPRPEEERERNQEDIRKRREEEEKKRNPIILIDRYIENGSVGDLEINSDYHDVELLAFLPDNLTVSGDFSLVGCLYLARLPKNLTVEGSFYLYDSFIKYLPDDIKIGNSIDCYWCSLEHIPDNFSVGGSLSLVHTRVSEIPYNMEIGGSFYIGQTPLIEKYTEHEIEKMIEEKGGHIGGKINPDTRKNNN